MKRPTQATLWTPDFTRMIAATALGAAGGIAGGFALSFLVFDETGSTLAAALTAALRLVPGFLVPLAAAPLMDRLPRKPFLVGGDALAGLLYLLAGAYLLRMPFRYGTYLGFSLLLSCIGAFDQLAYNALYPRLIPAGQEEKGYAVAGLLYPVLDVLMMPLAALLLDALGAPRILMLQGVLSLLAAAVESRIRVTEENRLAGQPYTLALWRADLAEAAAYLKNEPGLRAVYGYMAVTNGAAGGYGSIQVAFFRTAPGMSAALYALFTAAEFAGRTLGGLVQYRTTLPPRKKYGFAFLVYNLYELMDLLLLWLPWPLMLANRAACGFLGAQSAVMRQAAVQRYLPERLRTRINAFEEMLCLAASSVLSLAVGALGEVLDYRLCLSVTAAAVLAVCWGTIGRQHRAVRRVYERAAEGERGDAVG